MENVNEVINKLMQDTINQYNATIDYVAKQLKKHGEKGLPVVWDDENYVADAVYDDCECIRYEINAIRVSHRVYPEMVLEVHVVSNNHEVCDEWIEISDFDIETVFGIIDCAKF